MDNNFKFTDEEYELILLTEQHIQTLYNWNTEEKHFEQYTCRPLNLSQSFEEYSYKTLNAISEGKQRVYVLVKKGYDDIPLAKVSLFDFNSRNHSAEFGYYLPTNSRAKGFGSIMLAQFIKKVFDDVELDLNKIYATTASNNIPSIKLLEKYHFKLDGRMREHYWINEERYDQLIYSLLKNE